jgi:hypothetical protein
MNKNRATIVFLYLMAIGFANIFLLSCSDKSIEGAIIFTRSAGKTQELKSESSAIGKYIPQTQILILNPKKTGSTPKVLTGNYFSANSPKISFDGKFMLFAAQKKENDPWQIWEMEISNLKSRQVTNSKENCTDPVYLPSGRLLFSKFSANDTLKGGHALFTCNSDGTNLNRITFNPGTYLESNTLMDGRILTVGQQVYPSITEPRFMILRPDGTKADMFYKSAKDSFVASQGVETAKGNIVFIESDKANNGKGCLTAISYNRPLHSKINLSSTIDGDFHAVTSTVSSGLLVAFRKSDKERYALYEFDQDKKTLGKKIYGDPGYDVLEAVETGMHERPKKLPSEVDMGVKTGLLMCQDINATDLKSTTAGLAKSTGIEIVGIDSTLGVVEAAADGSFYLKVMADKPFRIQTVDKTGKIISGPGDWIWVRPNERRGCVGCHQDPEMVPANSVPLAVKKSPVVIPMHINKVVEKKVSLE